MSDSTRTQLRQILVSRYNYLVRRLERVVGSRDGASDALHETWMRIGSANVSAPIANADAYILRMANNVAIDQHRRDRRHTHDDNLDELLEVPDELSDVERVVAARRKVDMLKDALRGLPPRRRDILIAARLEGQLNREIAERFGISQRLVESELSAALKYCLKRIQEEGDLYPDSRNGPRKF